MLKADIPVENYLNLIPYERPKEKNEKNNNDDQTISLSAQILRVNWKLCLNLQS